MASLSKDGNGWRILFVCPATRKRPTIRLGECSKKNAQTALNMVESLVEAKSLGQPIKQQTAAWLEDIEGTPLRERLAKVGLVEASKTTTLAKFVDEFLDQRQQRGDVTEGTLTTWKHTRRNLVDYFGAGKDIRTIKPEHAAEWSAWLRTDQKLAENTIRKRCQFARRFFRVALKRKQISENPFMELAATTIPVPERQYFVEREVVDDLLDQCHGPEYRLLLVFARYLGVRVPSEIVPLKWSDVDWGRPADHCHVAQDSETRTGQQSCSDLPRGNACPSRGLGRSPGRRGQDLPLHQVGREEHGNVVEASYPQGWVQTLAPACGRTSGPHEQRNLRTSIPATLPPHGWGTPR